MSVVVMLENGSSPLASSYTVIARLYTSDFSVYPVRFWASTSGANQLSDLTECGGSSCRLRIRFPSPRKLVHTRKPPKIETHQRPIETAKEYVDSECEPNASLEETPDNDDYQAVEYLIEELKQNMFNASNKGRPKTLPYLFTAEEKKCCDCRAAFPTIEALLRHVIQQHSIRKTIHDPTRHVRCELCFKLFRSRASLYTHQSAPYKLHQYNCNTCGSCFLTPSRLAAHQIGHSTERSGAQRLAVAAAPLLPELPPMAQPEPHVSAPVGDVRLEALLLTATLAAAATPPSCCRYVCTSASLLGHSALIVLEPSVQLLSAC
uniref:C2H2-type domain-containing protein n=1 Tax=Anopheles epiroticus TaxID=199890 RepID=A0A182P0E2_9DIPT